MIKIIREALSIDEKDLKILKFYMKNPEISQNEIAEKLKLSQPSVFVRIQKLKKKGILDTKVGINLSKTKLFLCRVDLTSQNPNHLLEKMKVCPFFVNGFVMSGENNVSLMIIHEELKKIDEIVNTHLRNLDSVSNIRMNIAVSAAKDYVFQIDLDQELSPKETCGNQGGCEHCTRINLKQF